MAFLSFGLLFDAAQVRIFSPDFTAELIF